MKIKVRVYPRSNTEKVVESGSGLKVYLTAAPQRGKANKELLKVISSYLKVKKSSLNLIRGKASRDKIIEVS